MNTIIGSESCMRSDFTQGMVYLRSFYVSVK